ncbi:MAG TPA: flagellar biosynthesis anti-sigma factor FlgM [Tepidisphaeraceae bacterium]|nr:flagellar biosynthesis anti-sigma factor FlgM [Tepidisphaeraceae bacterium]
MSSINSIGPNTPIQKIQSQPVQKQVPASPAKQVKLTDRVELSNVSHLLQTLKANDIRADKVAAVKAQIESGAYETEARLDAALDRLMDDLAR